MANHPNRRLRGSLRYFVVEDREGACVVSLFAEAAQVQPPRDAYAELSILYDGRRQAAPPWLHHLASYYSVGSPAQARRWLSQPRYGFDSLAQWAEQHIRIKGFLPAQEPAPAPIKEAVDAGGEA